MNNPNVFLAAALLFAVCCKPAGPSYYPTFLCDETHEFQPTNGYATYEFTPASGIRLETRAFQFRYGTSPVSPNTIQVIVGKSHLYKLATPTVTNLYVLDRTTLTPLRGEAFSGFRSGDSGMFMIGRTDPNASPRRGVKVVRS